MCGQILAEMSGTRAAPAGGVRQVSLPGLMLQLRELEDFDGDNFGAQVVRIESPTKIQFFSAALFYPLCPDIITSIARPPLLALSQLQTHWYHRIVTCRTTNILTIILVWCDGVPRSGQQLLGCHT